MNPALRLIRGVGSTALGVVKVSVEWLPGFLMSRGPAKAAASVLGEPDLPPMSDDTAALHVTTRTDCAKCGTSISEDAAVRTLKKGLVHDTCPA